MLKKAPTEEVATYNGEMKKQGDERMGQVSLCEQDIFVYSGSFDKLIIHSHFH